MFGLLGRYKSYRNEKMHKYLSEKWPSIRKKGRWVFMLHRAVLSALFLAMIPIIANLVKNRPISIDDLLSLNSVPSFVISFMVAFVVGMLMAEGEWARTEAKYLKFRKKGEPSPS